MSLSRKPNALRAGLAALAGAGIIAGALVGIQAMDHHAVPAAHHSGTVTPGNVSPAHPSKPDITPGNVSPAHPVNPHNVMS